MKLCAKLRLCLDRPEDVGVSIVVACVIVSMGLACIHALIAQLENHL